MSPSRTPENTGPPHTDPSAARTALRDRIAQALNGVVFDLDASRTLADAVLPVVEVALAEQRVIAEQAQELLDIARQTSNTSERERARAVQRAEEAEQQRDGALAAVQRVRDLAEAATDEANRSLSRQFGGHPFPPFVPVAEILAALDRDGETQHGC